jgi:UDP-N-acetylmuramate--alanine ligase
MEGQECIAIAGTHGKTTTTAMAAWLLFSLHKDPSYIIGATSFNLGTNAHAGKGDFFVIEADEYDYMFLGLRPVVSIVTNVEHDHPDCFPTYQDMLEAFKKFIDRIVVSGSLIACGEDPGAVQMLEYARMKGIRSYSYGIEGERFDYVARGLTATNMSGYRFTFTNQNHGQGVEVSLQVPGIHNVRDALAVMAMADVLDFPLYESARSLEEFSGTSRRFEVIGEVSGVTVISDYAHHPAEISATLSAARGRYRGRRIWAIWQPHTYSRTRLLFKEFSSAFNEADIVVVTEVFAAREQLPEDGFSARRIFEHIPGKAVFIPDLVELRKHLRQQVRTGDVVIILSAGDADRAGHWLVNDLLAMENAKSNEE